MTQGERIRSLRKELNLTLEEFGERIGIKKSSLSLIENGKNNPSEQSMKSICREFNVNEEWLRYGTGEMFIALDKEDLLMEWAGRILGSESDSFRKRFVKMLMSLTEDEWKWIEEKAKELVNGEVDE